MITLIEKQKVVRRRGRITDQRQFVRLSLCMGRHHQKKFLGCLHTLSVKLPHDPSVPLLGVYPKEMNTGVKNKNLYMNVRNYSQTAKRLKHPKHPSTDEWLSKLVYLYNGVFIWPPKE